MSKLFDSSWFSTEQEYPQLVDLLKVLLFEDLYEGIYSFYKRNVSLQSSILSADLLETKQRIPAFVYSKKIYSYYPYAHSSGLVNLAIRLHPSLVSEFNEFEENSIKPITPLVEKVVELSSYDHMTYDLMKALVDYANKHVRSQSLVSQFLSASMTKWSFTSPATVHSRVKELCDEFIMYAMLRR